MSKRPPVPAKKADPGGLVVRRDHGKSIELQMGEVAVSPTTINAFAALNFALGTFEAESDLTLGGIDQAMRQVASKVQNNDLSEQEALLASHAATLNLMFAEMAKRAAMNLGQHMEATETYMRLALKCQNQARATIETLATIKNPPVVYARQANFNNGGQQQVNNGVRQRLNAPPRAEEAETAQTELLEADHAKRVDTRTAVAPSRCDSEMEPMGTLHRAENARR